MSPALRGRFFTSEFKEAQNFIFKKQNCKHNSDSVLFCNTGLLIRRMEFFKGRGVELTFYLIGPQS